MTPRRDAKSFEAWASVRDSPGISSNSLRDPTEGVFCEPPCRDVRQRGASGGADDSRNQRDVRNSRRASSASRSPWNSPEGNLPGRQSSWGDFKARTRAGQVAHDDVLRALTVSTSGQFQLFVCKFIRRVQTLRTLETATIARILGSVYRPNVNTSSSEIRNQGPFLKSAPYTSGCPSRHG